MPQRIKLLYVTTLHRTSGWLKEAFSTDSAVEVLLDEAVGVTAGLSKLRDEVFDAVLVSHEADVLNALEFVEGLRAGGNDEPMIVIAAQSASEMDALCYEAGADAYCSLGNTTTRMLLWTIARAIQRCQLVRENRRLLQAERQRLAHEHNEAERLLDQQRALIADLELLRDGKTDEGGRRKAEGGIEKAAVCLPPSPFPLPPSSPPLPEPLVKHYREMLRAYVIMGAGNLSVEMNVLADLLADAGISAQQTMQLHVQALEELIGGLGNRSARHVMNRADLLVLEVMAHLADGYRGRYHRREFPPRQLRLPGFDDHAPPSFVLRPAA
jgi:DNA-binding NarL/FixJ family response regulator